MICLVLQNWYFLQFIDKRNYTVAKLFLIDILNTGKGRIDPDFKKFPDSNFSLPRFLENLV